ncbi:proline dehydrogenase family protein [Georgenia faecalis]|uniref:proline dehydrogenase family protein n=1 Tax=Georgenia faecalis TaxID=2483799 RepID=UPI000F099D48|nr:proline dehydrogenase family protein [Georgenia faecalis]
MLGNVQETGPQALAPLLDEAVALGRHWLSAAEDTRTAGERETSERLSALLSDPAGLDLAVRFVDRVVRPEDDRAAARELARVPASAARFLSAGDRALLGLGARVAPLAPGVVVPLARRRLRQLVGHLLVDARDPALAAHLARARADGFRLNVNLLGEAVLGEREAAARTDRTVALLEREDVDYVSVKVSALVSQISPWDTPGSVARVLERLRPVYRAAARRGAFVNLDMEEYRDLDLTVEVFAAILREREFAGLEAGIVVQAYLPDSLAAVERLVGLARERHAAGAAPLKIRLVKGANLAMERVEAELHGWEQAPYPTKADVDANYLRLVERLVRPELAGVLRVGVGSHNVFDVALAHLLARGRAVEAMVDVEMLEGMSPAQARAVRADAGSVLLYTPVVAPADFDVAVSYLVRRLEENADPANFLAAAAAGAAGAAMDDQEEAFRRSVAHARTVSHAPRRRAERAGAGPTFTNAPDSDPAVAQVRAWAREVVAASPGTPRSAVLDDARAVDAVVARGRAAGHRWAGRPAAERAAVLRRAADEIEARRGRLVTAMAAEGGKTVGEADPEVSEAVDFARYYADRALDEVDGARFVPDVLTLVTPPWNFPVAIPAGSVLAALAAGSAVVLKPADAVPRCAEIVVEAIHAAGVAEDVLQVVRVDEGRLGRALVAHDGVDTVLLTGALETARLFAGWRAGHPGGPRVLAETSGKNAMVVTPAADLDLAVADLVRSAFGHAGQKCSAASLAILVGSVGTSRRFRRQLVDAVSSLVVGWPTDLGVSMGPVIEPPSGKLERALTRLDPGESWLVEPRPLDDTGRLWSPGVKDGVAPGSWYHRTEAFGPVLGLMRARTLDEALARQNATGYGLTGGLHSLDAEEIDHWLERVEVGNAYVNRHMTGAIVRRQSFGGWKGSAVGPGAKAGGPNYVAQLGRWLPAGLPVAGAPPRAEVAELLAALLPLVPEPEHAWLRAAVASDEAAATGALAERDESGLRAESNTFRYRPLPLLWVRAGEGARPGELVRVLLAARRVGTPVRVSLDPGVGAGLRAGGAADALRRLAGAVDRAESTTQFTGRVRAGEVTGRVRVVGDGPDVAVLAEALAERTEATLLTGPVLAAGRRELLTVLREQAVSRTRHRFGHPDAGR